MNASDHAAAPTAPRSLRSLRFRAEREASWRELEALLARLEAGRHPRRMPPEALERLPVLYRNALSSLSVARAISLDANLLAYLESLATRAHLVLHTRRRTATQAALRFFTCDFPAAVRQMSGMVWLAIAMLAVGAVAGHVLTGDDNDWFFAFVDADLAGERTPFADAELLRATLYDDGGGASLGAFALQLFVHNAGIGLLCVAIGAIGGVFVSLILFANGAMLGAMWTVFDEAGLAGEFAAWVFPHGVTELLAIALSGAAGLALGRALLFPGARSRREALGEAGRVAGKVALGAALLFAVAAFVEGLFRQEVTSVGVRSAVALGSALLWASYLPFAGRRRPSERYAGGDG